jgi:hypothetical protein
LICIKPPAAPKANLGASTGQSTMHANLTHQSNDVSRKSPLIERFLGLDSSTLRESNQPQPQPQPQPQAHALATWAEVSFERWTELSDAYATISRRLESGDLSVRAEARRLGNELQVLNCAMRGGRAAENEAPMKNGIYDVRFSSSQGELGQAAILIKNRAFVGADCVQFFRGEIERSGPGIAVAMEVTRYNFAARSAFGNDAPLMLQCNGIAHGDAGFKMECRPRAGLTVHILGKLIECSAVDRAAIGSNFRHRHCDPH